MLRSSFAVKRRCLKMVFKIFKDSPRRHFFLRNYIRIFLEYKLECFIIEISTQWILRCWQYKHNYINKLPTYTYLHRYLHFQSHIKISWNVFLLKKTNKIKLSGYCNKITECVKWLKLPIKEWTLSTKNVVKILLKGFLKSNDLLF